MEPRKAESSESGALLVGCGLALAVVGAVVVAAFVLRTEAAPRPLADPSVPPAATAPPPMRPMGGLAPANSLPSAPVLPPVVSVPPPEAPSLVEPPTARVEIPDPPVPATDGTHANGRSDAVSSGETIATIGGPVGSLSRESIQSVVRSHMGPVRACYESGLRRDPELAGRLTVMFVVGATGAVVSRSVRGSTLSGPQAPVVESCIAAEIGTWMFPPPDGGGSVAVNYPFTFESS